MRYHLLKIYKFELKLEFFSKFDLTVCIIYETKNITDFNAIYSFFCVQIYITQMKFNFRCKME